MRPLPPHCFGYRWPLAGGVLSILLLTASPGLARPQTGFSLETELRWPVAPYFLVNPPHPVAERTTRPNQAPQKPPSRQEPSATGANRPGLTLLRVPFSF